MATGWPMKTTYANGDVFSASDVNDITGTVNLAGGAQWAAGKNRLINGDFRINQRIFTSNTTTGSYNFDRWLQQNSGGSFTVTPQTFTAGAAPATPYEAINFLRGITASQSAAGDYAYLTQRVEDVRTLANTTATISFWAKANTGTPKVGVEINQNFGSGGSPSSAVSTPAGSITLSTSWARYSVNVTVPSISGKTIGTTANTSYVEVNLWTSSGATNATRASSIGVQNFTADFWGVQFEQGSTATAFQTATGIIEGELAAAQRYFYGISIDGTPAGISPFAPLGVADTTGAAKFPLIMPVTMRVAPSVTFTGNSNFRLFDFVNASSTSNSMSLYANSASTSSITVSAGATGLTQYRPYCLIPLASGVSTISISAEL